MQSMLIFWSNLWKNARRKLGRNSGRILNFRFFVKITRGTSETIIGAISDEIHGMHSREIFGENNGGISRGIPAETPEEISEEIHGA